MLLPRIVALSCVPIFAVVQEKVGLGNSFTTMSCASALLIPLFAASRSQLRSKAICCASAKDNLGGVETASCGCDTCVSACAAHTEPVTMKAITRHFTSLYSNQAGVKNLCSHA